MRPRTRSFRSAIKLSVSVKAREYRAPKASPDSMRSFTARSVWSAARWVGPLVCCSGSVSRRLEAASFDVHRRLSVRRRLALSLLLDAQPLKARFLEYMFEQVIVDLGHLRRSILHRSVLDRAREHL